MYEWVRYLSDFHKSLLSDVKSKSCQAIFVFMTINFIELSYYRFKLKRSSLSHTYSHWVVTAYLCVCVRLSKDRRNSTPKLANIRFNNRWSSTTILCMYTTYIHLFFTCINIVKWCKLNWSMEMCLTLFEHVWFQIKQQNQT